MEQHPSVGEQAARRLLLALGTAMIAGGQPVYEAEDELRRVGRTLGYGAVQVNAAPTTVMVSLRSGDATAIQSVRQPYRLDQSVTVNRIRRGLLTGELGIAPALARLAEIRRQRPRFGLWGGFVGWIVICTCICLILQPALPNLVFVALFSVVVWAMAHYSGRHPMLATLLPVATSFVVSLGAFGAYQLHLLDGPLRTLICPIAILLPGATLATGIAELAAGMMVAGSSRLVFGLVQLLLFSAGVVGAAAVLRTPLAALSNVKVDGLGPGAAVIGLVGLAIGMSLAESLPWRLACWALLLLCLTFSAQSLGNQAAGSAVGAFYGAVAAALGASAIDALRPNVPRLVVFLPSFWLLVPGTLGVIGITQVARENAAPVAMLMSVVNVVLAIAIGLLIGSTLARPLYPLVHRAQRRRQRRRA